MGFKWKKTRNKRAVLVERPDIICMRMAYLRAIKKYREKGTYAYNIRSETYIHSTHTHTHTSSNHWSDDSSSDLLAPISKDPRAIIVHA
ncbi:hypothetical protein C0J52_09008 [Blattella germanica]|nr:hypothetical protein C0J52_13904 [Blattella germanica]PSN55720.1 hypothetical protein C0J52_09008 [Blattella germanica]